MIPFVQLVIIYDFDILDITHSFCQELILKAYEPKRDNIKSQNPGKFCMLINTRKLPSETNQKIYSHIVEIYSHNDVDKQVKIITQDDNNHSVELISQVNNFGNIRVAFYTVVDGKRKRQVISLDGYFINALNSISILKADVPKRVQSQIDSWPAFDSKLPVTRQIKYLIMHEVVKGLSGSDAVFYPQIDS